MQKKRWFVLINSDYIPANINFKTYNNVIEFLN